VGSRLVRKLSKQKIICAGGRKIPAAATRTTPESKNGWINIRATSSASAKTIPNTFRRTGRPKGYGIGGKSSILIYKPR
jgi:hypothetical protein